VAAYPDPKHNAATSITLPPAVTQKTPACSANCLLLDFAAIVFADVGASCRGSIEFPDETTMRHQISGRATASRIENRAIIVVQILFLATRLLEPSVPACLADLGRLQGPRSRWEERVCAAP